MEKRELVAYFSCSGVTERVARELAKATGAELYEIRPERPYTSADLDWTDRSSRTTIEMKDPDCRPAIAGDADISGYDVVYLGFPIWWYVAPRIIQTFLESHDFSGKTIQPFFTSGGSGAGRTDEVLRASAPNAVWKPSVRLTANVRAEELRSRMAAEGI